MEGVFFAEGLGGGGGAEGQAKATASIPHCGDGMLDCHLDWLTNFWSLTSQHKLSVISTTGVFLGVNWKALEGRPDEQMCTAKEVHTLLIWITKAEHITTEIFFCIPSYISGVHHFFGDIFTYMIVS